MRLSYPSYAPSCTEAVLRVLPHDKPMCARAVHVCLGDTLNREGHPVQYLSVQCALRWLHDTKRARRVRPGLYIRVVPDPLPP